MFYRVAVRMLAPIVVLSTWTTADACFRMCYRGGSDCGSCCVSREACGAMTAAPCESAYVEVEKTIMVPTMVTEKRTVKECSYAKEERSKEVQYTVCVPTKKTGTREVTTYSQVPEEQTMTYTVCVPYAEQQEITVHVCRMVPKKVKVKVPACGSGCATPCN